LKENVVLIPGEVNVYLYHFTGIRVGSTVVFGAVSARSVF